MKTKEVWDMKVVEEDVKKNILEEDAEEKNFFFY